MLPISSTSLSSLAHLSVPLSFPGLIRSIFVLCFATTSREQRAHRLTLSTSLTFFVRKTSIGWQIAASIAQFSAFCWDRNSLSERFFACNNLLGKESRFSLDPQRVPVGQGLGPVFSPKIYEMPGTPINPLMNIKSYNCNIKLQAFHWG